MMTRFGAGTSMPRPDDGGDLEMTQPAYQTVRLAKGRHDSPDRGVCVMELASMLAGERFTDHPRGVCPVIAGFLRSYNDLLPDGQQDEMYAYATLVVGTSAGRSVRRQRARRVLAWGERSGRRHRRHPLFVRLRPWDFVLLPAVQAALRMDPEPRRVAVRALLDELCAMGSAPAASALAAAPAPAPVVPRGGDGGAPAAALSRAAGAAGAPAGGFTRWS
jgi:hypothetical protein